MTELAVLQAVRLKGRVKRDELATTVGQGVDGVESTMADLVTAGLLVDLKALRISPTGRERLDQLLAAERASIDTAALSATYDEFREANVAFKDLVCDWQLKGGEPNPHDDAEYDAAVLRRLDEVHARVKPIIASAAAQLPRLQSYADKLDTALRNVAAGEAIWFTRPTIDSYHTVWFELHEELILACGLTRQGEAEAGHAH